MEDEAAPMQWKHYVLDVPDSGGRQQVRVELLQPGRVDSWGARLYVRSGAVDCSRRDAADYDFEAPRPAECLDNACKVLAAVPAFVPFLDAARTRAAAPFQFRISHAMRK